VRFSLLLPLLLIGGCGRPSVSGWQRVVLLPVEDLRAEAAADGEAEGIRVAVWNALQGQSQVQAVMAAHRRDLPELGAGRVLEGYFDGARYRLRWGDEALTCDGGLERCAAEISSRITGSLGVQGRPVPKAVTLRAIATGRGFAAAASTNPELAAAWLGWAGEVQLTGGPGAALQVLSSVPVDRMTPYDAARIRVKRAELQMDRAGYARELDGLAKAAPGDPDIQEQAAAEAIRRRDAPSALRFYEASLALRPRVPAFNQAAYAAIYAGEKAKAERMAEAAIAAMPLAPEFVDTRGDVAYFFRDYAGAAKYYARAAELNAAFLNGLALWKAADATRLAGDMAGAEALLARYIEARKRTGLRNPLLLEAVWAWRCGKQEEAVQKLQTAAESMDRGRALFLLALVALHQKDFASAERFWREMDSTTIESAFLRSLLQGAPLPGGFPFPQEAVTALRLYLRGDLAGARESYAAAREKFDLLGEGQWRTLSARVEGREPSGTLPPSPDDWLSIVLR
jgi:tetratricopeptide (TPR) repeat protein